MTLTAFALWIPERFILLRSLLALLVSLAFLAVQCTLKPFKRSADNWLSVFFHFALALIFVCILLLNVCTSDSETCDQFGLGSDGEGLFLFFLLFSTIVLLGVLILGVCQLAHASKSAMGSLYLRATGNIPELALEAGITYNLFLSHVWSSAQDQVAVIKR